MRISCLDNLKQMSFSRHMYTDDNKGKLILAVADEDSVDASIADGRCQSADLPFDPCAHDPAAGGTGWGTADTTYFGTNFRRPGFQARPQPGVTPSTAGFRWSHTPVDSMTQYFFRKEADLQTPATTPLF